MVWVLAAPGLAVLCAAAVPRNAVNQSPGHRAEVTPRACENREGAGGALGNHTCGWKGEAEAQGKLEVFTKFCICCTQREDEGGGTQINNSVNLW